MQPALPIRVLTGPTAAGKTRLALELAESAGCEIVSMDSMAVYRRMDIGTAKPDAAALARIPHHLCDVADPGETFDAHRFCELADRAVAEIRARGREPLFVGGTPLYMMAFFKGMIEGPTADPEFRAALERRERETPGCLHAELGVVDPAAADRIHRNDLRRIVRALEVLHQTGKPISEQQTTFEAESWRVPCRIVALSRDREELHSRVRARTIEMLERGLVEEVRSILDDAGFSNTSSAAIGYRECIDFLRGRYKDLEELRNRIRRSTHKLIRRQTTWLRHLGPQVRWVSPDAPLEDLIDAFESPRC
ncbi:MAG: tRNA (adenosine(37)-N6)-dimethylallyltransferase MiaA [Planctomycetes bacterium]|nr:tRNA (adenosine(37)-N6)-dimethylallyltransferase MiaA [Planctomycetota bacterium]